jgi:DNA-binding NarL/FixJ family response regulator
MIMKRITVLLAEDHTVVREGLRRLLEAEEDLEVIGEAQTGREAVKMAGKLRPAVIVMDIAMPLLNGLEATRQILQAGSASKVLILSAHSDDAYVEEATEAGAAGSAQTDLRDVLAKAIREVEKETLLAPPFPSAFKISIEGRLMEERMKDAAPPKFARDGGPATDCRRQG